MKTDAPRHPFHAALARAALCAYMCGNTEACIHLIEHGLAYGPTEEDDGCARPDELWGARTMFNMYLSLEKDSTGYNGDPWNDLFLKGIERLQEYVKAVSRDLT
jgi:hypothetical protein